MNRQEAEARTKIITMMLSVYGNSSDKTMIASYVELLKEIPVELLNTACKKVTLENEFQPRPATILKAAKSLMGKMSGTDMLPWAEAWKEIETQMKEAFVYAKPVFSRPEIEQTVKAFGWVDLCQTPQKDLQTARAQLRNMYQEVCEKKKECDLDGYLLGNNKLIENTNVKMIV